MRGQLIGQFWAEEDGATAIEYGLIAGLISIIIVASLTSLGSSLGSIFSSISSAVSGAEKTVTTGTTPAANNPTQ